MHMRTLTELVRFLSFLTCCRRTKEKKKKKKTNSTMKKQCQEFTGNEREEVCVRHFLIC